MVGPSSWPAESWSGYGKRVITTWALGGGLLRGREHPLRLLLWPRPWPAAAVDAEVAPLLALYAGPLAAASTYHRS